MNTANFNVTNKTNENMNVGDVEWAPGQTRGVTHISNDLQTAIDAGFFTVEDFGNSSVEVLESAFNTVFTDTVATAPGEPAV